MNFTGTTFFKRLSNTILATLFLLAFPIAASSEIDGHGPDAWRVNGISSNDTLNMRMGPGTNYPVLGSLAHNAVGLRLITCVPFYGHGGGVMWSEAERAALPPRWCLIQHPDLIQAGWVAQRYIVEDNTAQSAAGTSGNQLTEAEMLDVAEELVRGLYEMRMMANAGQGPDPLDPAYVGLFFSADVVSYLQANQLQVDPLFNGQDFSGSYEEPYRDPQEPMFRGMITILVDFINFGQRQQAIVRLRADTLHPDRAVRIMRIEHDGWVFP